MEAGLRLGVGKDQPIAVSGDSFNHGNTGRRPILRNWSFRFCTGCRCHRLDQVKQLHRIATAVALSVVIDKGPSQPVREIGVAVNLNVDIDHSAGSKPDPVLDFYLR
ncbi:hypothetical protein [Burkholderia sp. Ac-20349]|uniref:hypothetical protein n=1 Tax=Burkholderia TaxID=32008 RepID=UPI00197BB5C5|nr:hypothetical protein [Burkholderia sp. Ac-20349]MBN3841013.1 hypothetical protein [Burkholderia sp. Ac-20349]